ncbi:unnamed protein product [Linum trigynum]|uniref:Uncharacterized protein n=1 Tax=Linum trigynum TaxID=586398 RepID=A0AAV2DDR5_9ROSI
MVDDDEEDTPTFPDLPTVQFPDTQAHGGHVAPTPFLSSSADESSQFLEPQNSSFVDHSPESPASPSSADEDHSTDEDFADAEPDYQEESDDELLLGD